MGLILVYVVGYVIFVDSGYQGTSPVVGTVNVKFKNPALQNNTGTPFLWDSVDLVVPPMEANAAFITTNSHITKFQKQGLWLDPDTKCGTDNTCTEGTYVEYGILTGRCANLTGFGMRCELFGWGPVEQNSAATPEGVLTHTAESTLFIRCSVNFPSYKILESNYAEGYVEGQNGFTVAQLLEKAQTTFDDCAQFGAIISVTVSWECAFDPWSNPCVAKFEATRIDTASEKSKGFNFRYAHSYYLSPDGTTENAVRYRDLFKAYGIRFFFNVAGEGRRFSIVPLLVNIGSGMALLAVATIITDLLAMYLFPGHEMYAKAKYKYLEVNGRSISESSEEETSGRDYVDQSLSRPSETSKLY